MATVGDIDSDNDSSSDSIPVIATPSPVIAISPSPLVPGQQATVRLTIPTAFPHAFSGSLSVGFASDAAIPVADPAIQFATGGRQASFTFAANALQAQIMGSSQIGFQPGTVAGTLTFTGTVQAGNVQSIFTPASSSGPVVISQQPPVVSNVKKSNDSGPAILITLQSSTREVTQMSLQFQTNRALKLSCGSVPACTVSGSTITFDVRSQFASWYASDTVFGSLSTLRVPFSVSGDVSGSVVVTLTNSKGASNARTISIP